MPRIEPPRPVALITGASGGIGEALARILAAQGEDVVLVARSGDRLAAVAAAIAADSGRAALALPADLEEPGAADRIRAALADRGLVVRHLVNNAGYGLAGDMAVLPRAGQTGIVDLNCRALLDLTLAFLPDVTGQVGGGILNVASVAGFTAGPGFAVYYASKAFVVSLTRALAFELREGGTRVCALCPGPTPTRFNERAGFKGGRIAGWLRPLDADAVAAAGIAGYRAGRTLVVPGLANAALVALLGILPQTLVLPLLARVQRSRLSGSHAPPFP